MNKLLLHICCGICAGPIIRKYRQAEFEVTGYFYNPNIHPYQEFWKRLEAVESLSQQENLPIYYEWEYGLDKFLAGVMPYAKAFEPSRCAKCYEMRLRQTVRFAKQNGFKMFTSTLSISPYQNQESIKNTGAKMAQETGISFMYEPLTCLFPESKELARKHNLYRQQYCGCIFSEYERYAKK